MSAQMMARLFFLLFHMADVVLCPDQQQEQVVLINTSDVFSFPKGSICSAALVGMKSCISALVPEVFFPAIFSHMDLEKFFVKAL